MGMLIEGRWNDGDLRRVEPTGELKRPESPLRHYVGTEYGSFPAVMDRTTSS